MTRGRVGRVVGAASALHEKHGAIVLVARTLKSENRAGVHS